MNRIYEDIKNAAQYERLSDEDREKRGFSIESDSITSQKLLIEQFCNDKRINLVSDFYDDGITGLTFERDGWNELLKEIKAGRVDCVITKDLSRLGRDHSETGYYIEKFFPENRVRYISINDNWDSKYDSVDLILWKLAYNDVYCADISRKVKSVLDSKKKQGLYVGSFAPYGYKKKDDDKHHLEIDPETAPIVKEAFELAFSGLGTHKIATIFSSKNYTTPGIYSGRGKPTITREKVGNFWTSGMVRRILANEVYMGDLTQSKIKKASYKSKKVIKNDRDNWIIVKDTHEPLVSREVFKEIQKMLELTSKKYNRLPGETHLLSKLLICNDCGHRINVGWKSSKYHERGRCGVCNFYKKYSKHQVCTPHYIDYDELETQILSYIKKISMDYLKYINTPSMVRNNYKNLQAKLSELENKKKKLVTDKDKSENIMLKLYEDKLNEIITEAMYKTLSEKKLASINVLNEQIKDLEFEMRKIHTQLDKDQNKIEDIKTILNNFLNSEIMTQDLIHQIIDKIYVSENDKIKVVFKIEELETLTAS